MPALEPHGTMENARAVVEEGDRSIDSPVKKEEHVTDNNNIEVVTSDGPLTKYNPQTTPPPNNGYSTQIRNSYSETLPPVYIASSLASVHSPHINYRPFTTSVNNTESYTTQSTTTSPVNNFHCPYQTSPPSIDKAPSFVVRSLSESSKSTTPPSPTTTPPEDKHVWSKSEIELLLDLYETYKEQLKDPRVRKTKVWDDVARIIREKLESDVTGCQCNQKFRNLKADFQKVLDHNGRPGNFKRVCKYYDRLASILSYQSQGNRAYPHPYPPHEVHENAMARMQRQRELYYDNRNQLPKANLKRKLSQESLLLNEHALHGHTHPAMVYMDNNKRQKLNSCTCECANEVTSLRETVERINNHIISRAAHEEERIRRMEEIHREKLLALSRFVDIFKDFVIKMT